MADLLAAWRDEGLPQAKVAARMDTSQSVVARPESPPLKHDPGCDCPRLVVRCLSGPAPRLSGAVRQ